MVENSTRTTTLPGERSASCSCSKPATTPSPSLRIRNALNAAVMVRHSWWGPGPASAGALTPPIVPHEEALCIEIEVVPEQTLDLRVWLRTSVLARQTQPQLQHIGANGGVAVSSVHVTAGDCHELADLSPQRLGETRHVAYPTVVHQIHRLGSEAEHPVDGGDELLRIELRRGGRGGDESALRRVEMPVRDAERVPGEDARVSRIDDRIVMQRVPGCMYQLEVATCEIIVLAILHDSHAVRRDRHQLAIELLEALLS